jgi:hypothetical protein
MTSERRVVPKHPHETKRKPSPTIVGVKRAIYGGITTLLFFGTTAMANPEISDQSFEPDLQAVDEIADDTRAEDLGSLDELLEEERNRAAFPTADIGVLSAEIEDEILNGRSPAVLDRPRDYPSGDSADDYLAHEQQWAEQVLEDNQRLDEVVE